MAHLLYALNGQGRGHTSRSLAVAHTLRQRGHAVTFCCGGEAAERLRALGESVLGVPAPVEVVRGNRVRLLASAWQNGPLAVQLPEILEHLTERMRDFAPDLVVSDFEPFAPRAARRLGIPAVALDRQHVLTETRYPVPWRYAASTSLTRLGVQVMAPRHLFARCLVPTFAPAVAHPRSHVTLVPPILRPDVLSARPSDGGYVLVYVNHPDGAEGLLHVLAQVNARFIVYNLPQPADQACSNVTFRPASRAGFVRDLAGCRAVLCTAGFTLLSEALHLGKPVLALPNRGFFEQTFNALALERTGRGHVLTGRLTAQRLERALGATGPQRSGGTVGNSLAADSIEAALGYRRRIVSAPENGSVSAAYAA